MPTPNRSEARHREVERWLSPRLIGFTVMSYGMMMSMATMVVTLIVPCKPLLAGGLSSGCLLIRFGARLAADRTGAMATERRGLQPEQ